MQRKTSLADVLELYLLDCAARNLTQSTQTFYKSKLDVFITWCTDHGVTDLEALTPHDIRRYLVDARGRGLSSQYQNNLARAIRAFLNYAVRDGLLEKSPMSNVKMPKIKNKILSAYTDEELGAILDSCETQRDTALLLLLLDSGVRASELISLNVGHVDLYSGTVTVEDGKGQKGRVTHIGAKTRKAVLRYLLERGKPADNEPLFVGQKRGGRLTLSGIVQLMRRLAAKSEVEEVTAHKFRRTMAITSLRNGMNVHVLARILGHADIGILRQYLDIVESDTADAHRKAGPVDNMT
ncbi:MAG: tyrosine-type recombinase/integrase [Caldilineaceae bacterium]